MGIIDWMANIDPSVRVVAGFGFVVLGLVLTVLRLSYTQAWAGRQATHRPTHAPRWYRRQTSAADLIARMRAEREVTAFLREVTDPVGRPIYLAPRRTVDFDLRVLETRDSLPAIAAAPDQTWLTDAFVDTQTIERVS
jgi:hypothetical protein